MKYETLVPQIMDLIGKEDNVKNLVHCSTRLRFKVYDMNKVDVDGLKNLQGIAGVKVQSDGVQLIVGQDVEDAYDIIVKNYKLGGKEETKKDDTSNNTKKENIFFRVMSWIADCLVPMLPALIASGLTTAIITVLSAVGLMSTESMTYQILDAIADAVLNFIPMFVVYGTAKKMDVNPMLSFAVVAVLLYSGLWGLAADGETYLYLFGFLPIRLFSYTSTIFPAMLCVICQKYIQQFIKKICPKMFAIFLEPLLTFLILAIVVLVVIGPIGAYIGDALGNLIIAGSQNYAWLICLILAGFGNFLVGSGMHYCLIPAVIMIFSQLGYDTFYGGACFAGAFALAGSVLAVFFKSKNKEVKQVASSTGITALIGVSEPAIYGMFFKYKSVMMADCIAGAIAGLLSGILGCHSYGMAPAGITTIMLFAGDTFVNLIIVITVAFALGFVLSYILYSDEKEGVTNNA